MHQTILLIDESGQNREQVESIGKRPGESWQVVSAGEREFSQKARNLIPDYVLIDASSYTPDLIEELERLEKDRIIHHTPVLFLFDPRQKESICNLLEYRTAHFLLKPVDPDELYLRLQAAKKWYHYIKQLNRTNERLSNLSEVARNTSNAVVIFQTDGSIEWANEGFERMYGYTPEAYRQLHDHIIFSAQSDHLQVVLDHFRGGGESFSLDHQIITRSGQHKWIQTTLTPIRNVYGYLDKMVAIESDVTELRKEKEKSDNLLLNILPFEIAEQLKKKGAAKSRKYRSATVMFADFANFTGLTEVMSVHDLINELNRYVQKFDELIDHHFVEKIKTIGDAYMCAGGLPLKNYSHPFDVVLAALEIRDYVRQKAVEKQRKGEHIWQLRIGIHTGEVMAGVIGSKRFAYDIWGRTVNIANEMEEMSEVGAINVSGSTVEYIQDYFELTYRGEIRMKNTGEPLQMYFVNRLKPEFSKDSGGIYPNQKFQKVLAKY